MTLNLSFYFRFDIDPKLEEFGDNLFYSEMKLGTLMNNALVNLWMWRELNSLNVIVDHFRISRVGKETHGETFGSIVHGGDF